MFGDLRRFDSGLDAPFHWLQQWLEQGHPTSTPRGAADIRSLARDSFPAINVGRTDEAVHVYLFVPGVDPSALEISVQGNLLTVSGKRELLEQESASGEAATHYRQERLLGEFRRSISLPEGLDVDRAEARHRHGVCEVVLPKCEELKPRRIDVEAVH
ncbi:Hsp20/alpha crystallin family protein [Halomonas sp.]|uniref:Hsp20/alpha crystallin family protein n=1 Tax=Halomonas sp. TaxID=1486246 RepID=UPI00258074A5|nr:Hsp20/alpha crystallin family protein [Halomonas sp.]MCJ8284607.1 Hsp20/alpha crystallin family protein [Halomonas sp.]NQY69661.1 Hsp20/alpha crystallin family protein [Halomonas sp.]